MREFSRGGQSVCVYLATFLSQHQDKELIGYWSALLSAGQRSHRESGSRGGRPQLLNEVQLGEPQGRRPARLVYLRVGESEMRRGIEAQFGYALARLQVRRPPASALSQQPCVPDCAGARVSMAVVRECHGGQCRQMNRG